MGHKVVAPERWVGYKETTFQVGKPFKLDWLKSQLSFIIIRHSSCFGHIYRDRETESSEHYDSIPETW